MEEIKSIEELQHLLKTRYEAVELLKAFHNEHSRLKWNEEDYIEFIEKIENILSDYEDNLESKGE